MLKSYDAGVTVSISTAKQTTLRSHVTRGQTPGDEGSDPT